MEVLDAMHQAHLRVRLVVCRSTSKICLPLRIRLYILWTSWSFCEISRYSCFALSLAAQMRFRAPANLRSNIVKSCFSRLVVPPEFTSPSKVASGFSTSVSHWTTAISSISVAASTHAVFSAAFHEGSSPMPGYDCSLTSLIFLYHGSLSLSSASEPESRS